MMPTSKYGCSDLPTIPGALPGQVITIHDIPEAFKEHIEIITTKVKQWRYKEGSSEEDLKKIIKGKYPKAPTKKKRRK